MWRESVARTPTSDRLVMLRAAHDFARDVNGTARGGPRPLIPEVMMIAHFLADLDADERDERDEREPADRAEPETERAESNEPSEDEFAEPVAVDDWPAVIALLRALDVLRSAVRQLART